VVQTTRLRHKQAERLHNQAHLAARQNAQRAKLLNFQNIKKFPALFV
jgi:hypothetical protein